MRFSQGGPRHGIATFLPIICVLCCGPLCFQRGGGDTAGAGGLFQKSVVFSREGLLCQLPISRIRTSRTTAFMQALRCIDGCDPGMMAGSIVFWVR